MPASAIEVAGLWVYVVLVGGWLVQRWARALLTRQSKPTSLDRLCVRWPSFGRDELEQALASYGGDAEAAGESIQEQVLDGRLPTLVDVEVAKEHAGSRLGCMMAGMPSHLPSVSSISAGSLAASALRVSDVICRINGELALGVQLAQRLLAEPTGTVRLQVHRRQSPCTADELEHSCDAGDSQKGLRQRIKPSTASSTGNHTANTAGAQAGGESRGATLAPRAAAHAVDGIQIREAVSTDLADIRAIFSANECLVTIGKQCGRSELVSIGQGYIDGVLSGEMASWASIEDRFSAAGSRLWVLLDAGSDLVGTV
eukprot:4254279-Prymnesium_polylepis.1